MVAVPLQVAVPLPRVAVVAAPVEPYPVLVMLNDVPPAMVFVPVSVTVAAPPVLPLLNPETVHVCPALPVIDPPDV